MGSRAKRRREHRKKINVNPKRAISKERRRKAPRVASEQLKAVWDEEKTARQNIENAGLAYDVNKNINECPEGTQPAKCKTEVVAEIEREAYKPRRDRSFVLKDDMMFLAQMICKHGLEEYESMAKDPDNIYQLTPKQIKRIYARAQKVPAQYNALMMVCGLRKVPAGYSIEGLTTEGAIEMECSRV